MKKIITVFLSVLMCLNFVACNSDTGNSDDGATVDESQINVPETTVKEEPKIKVVNLGDTIETAFMEMTVTEMEITERLKCSLNSRGDSVILGEYAEGKKVVCFSGEIKNIHTDSIGNVYKDNDCIWGNICFDNKYNYEFKMYIRNGEDFEGKITPFSKGTFYLYAYVPDELLEIYSTCTVNFGFCENLESYDSSFGEGFSFDKCEYKYSITVTK